MIFFLFIFGIIPSNAQRYLNFSISNKLLDSSFYELPLIVEPGHFWIEIIINIEYNK